MYSWLMEDGPIGASGQSAEVGVDKVIRRGTDLVPTPGRSAIEETAMDLLQKDEYATLEDVVLVCHVLVYSLNFSIF